MSQESDRIKRLVDFKRNLEKKIADSESELKDLQTMLEIVNSILLEKGFKRVEIPKEPVQVAQPKETAPSEPEYAPTQPASEAEGVIQLKTVTGELLANIYTGDDSLKLVPAEDKNFDVNTPPFTQFLVERVLMKMQERDSELARAEQLAPERIFSYNIVREGDILRELTIKNVDADRVRELKSSIRWTLEKMREKAKS